MGKIFDMDFRKGSLIDSAKGVVGALTDAELNREEKGLAYEGREITSHLSLSSDVSLIAPSSLEWWCKIRPKDYQGIIGRDTVSWAYVRLGNNAGNEYNAILMESDTNADGATISFDSPISKGWNHFIMTLDSSRILTLYLNGVKQADDAESISDDLTFNKIGTSRGSDYLNGYVGRVSVYDHILTSDERAKLYKQFLDASPITKTIR